MISENNLQYLSRGHDVARTIFRHATARTDAIPFDGAYCQDLQMWVISAGADMIPVIDCQVEARTGVEDACTA